MSRKFDLSTDTNDNVLVVGGPGTGKTRYYVKPNLLQANASFFVTDPKGTLIREMGGALAELGYEIRAFDTIDFTRSMRFNPIAYIRDEAGVIRFARGIVANTEGEADHKGDPTGRRPSAWSTPRSRPTSSCTVSPPTETSTGCSRCSRSPTPATTRAT